MAGKLTTSASRRLEDRIYTLVEKAIATKNPDELEVVINDLREALKEHTARLRKLASSNQTDPKRRKDD